MCVLDRSGLILAENRKSSRENEQGIDHYGRLVAESLLACWGQDAGLELLKQGLCWVYEKYIPQATIEVETNYRVAQATAQSDTLALWRDPNPVPPWEWRRSR